MSLFHVLSQTRLGKWLHRQQNDDTLGPLIRQISAGLRATEHRIISLWPPYVVHDLRQQAKLRAFARHTETTARGSPAPKKAPAE